MSVLVLKKGSRLVETVQTWREARASARQYANYCREQQAKEILAKIAGQGSTQRERMGWSKQQDWSAGFQPRASRKGSSARYKQTTDCWKRHRRAQAQGRLPNGLILPC